MKASLRHSRRTKIVCTIGPATEDREALEALVDAGMNVARLNFSHGEPGWHRERVRLLREISARRGRPIGIMQDIPGPKLRIGEIPEGPVELRSGDTFVLTTDEVEGSVERVSVGGHPSLPEELQAGDRILLADGEIELQVRETGGREISCRVITGGPLSSRKGMNFPDRSLSVPILTDRDREAIRIGIELGVDFVALSFVRTPEDVRQARALIAEGGGSIPLIAKIEKHEALDNLAEILAEVDALLVARGDLAVETPLEEVPQVQKRIIRAANEAGKPVITATQMLRSMVSAPRPTRAESTDVANALYDGTDAVMLSEETAIGSYPVKAVEIMHRICVATERDIAETGPARMLPPDRRHSVSDAVAAAAALVARHVDADALLIPTRTGSSAIQISSLRPPQPILAISTHPVTCGRLTLAWGIVPLVGDDVPSHEAMLAESERCAMEAGLLDQGDLVVITAGFPVGGPGSTNTVTVKAIGEKMETGRRSWREQPGVPPLPFDHSPAAESPEEP